jgi:cell division protease FtsH
LEVYKYQYAIFKFSLVKDVVFVIIYQKLAILCGGRAAEEVVFDSITTGASNDIEKATQIARSMVTRYGMSNKFGMMALETGGNTYLGHSGQSSVSPETARLVDIEVQNLIKNAYEIAKDLLLNNREKLDELVAYLMDKETITGEEFMKILNK